VKGGYVATQTELRRIVRRPLAAAVEVTDAKSGERLASVTSDVGLFGCFVETEVPFPNGAAVNVKITHHNKTFTTAGSVAHVLPRKGMGIAYGALTRTGYAILQEWLAPDKV
jgi:hypothetical protein